MQHKFLNFFLEKKDILSIDNEVIAPVLIENNKSQLEDLYGFYSSNAPLLFINGFLGTGKVQLTKYSLNFLSKEVIILKYNCFETTVLDDIFLGFFAEFKRLQAQKIIDTPKVRTENFTQKINAYFTYIEKPFLIILDSFEALSEENRKEITDFLTHISTLNKVKTIIIGRVFKSEMFGKGLKVERITTTALEKTLVEKYLKQNKIKYSVPVLDEFYKQTRGYYFFTSISCSIIKQKDITLDKFMDNFKKSFQTFYEYLIKESLDIIPALSVRFFWVLCLLRHGVTVSLLKELNLYDESQLNHLKSLNMLSIDNLQIYVQDYFKEQIDKSIPQNVKLKLHQMIANLYESQLPLKPLERTVLLSRQTMRNELEYHTLFLPKKQIIHTEGSELSYISYTKEKDFDLTASHIAKTNAKNTETKEWVSTKKYDKTESDKDVDLVFSDADLKDLPFKLTEQEMALLAAEIPSMYAQTQPLPAPEEPDEVIQLTLQDILDYAKVQEAQYKYHRMIELYLKALTFEDDVDYYLHLPVIYTKLGQGFQKMSDWENALKYYEMAKDFYSQTQEKIKENYISLSIANIYYETYKHDKAKALLLEILSLQGNPEILSTKAYIALANIEDTFSNIDKAYEYYKKAIELSNSSMDVDVLSELYFKYALIADDKNESTTAEEYYNRCINIEKNYLQNKFLSAAYSNLAALLFEKKDIANTIENYLKAYAIDEKINNHDGMYFSASKLAQVMQRKAPEKALEYHLKAKECAHHLNEIFYMASSSLALGDFYYGQKQDANALKEYLWAFELVKNDFSKDNLNKIQTRINDIKFRIGSDEFTRLENDFKKK